MKLRKEKRARSPIEDAATRLAGTPAVCGPDMVKKDFLAVQRARAVVGCCRCFITTAIRSIRPASAAERR